MKKIVLISKSGPDIKPELLYDGQHDWCDPKIASRRIATFLGYLAAFVAIIALVMQTLRYLEGWI